MSSLAARSANETPAADFSHPIHRLPTEVLVLILEHYIGLFKGSVHRRLVTLTLVCRQWQSSVETSPELWTSITWGDRASYREKALVKSKGAPLSIWWYDRFAWDVNLIDYLRPHIHRVRRLYLVAPLLEELFLKEINKSAVHINLFGGRIHPSLREMSICGAAIAWWAPFTQALHRLRIELSGSPVHPLSDVLNVLRQCAHLTTLSLLSHYANINELEPPAELEPAVNLPFLENLRLRLPAKTILCLLDCLSTPRLKEIALHSLSLHKFYNTPGIELEYHESLLRRHAIPTFQKHSTTVMEFDVGLLKNDGCACRLFELTSSSQKGAQIGELKIECQADDQVPLFSQLAGEMKKHVHSISLHIHSFGPNNLLHHVHLILPNISPVKELHVPSWGIEKTGQPTIRFLGLPTLGLPDLETLSFIGTDVADRSLLEPLLALVQHRYGWAYQSRIARLKQLTIYYEAEESFTLTPAGLDYSGLVFCPLKPCTTIRIATLTRFVDSLQLVPNAHLD